MLARWPSLVGRVSWHSLDLVCNPLLQVEPRSCQLTCSTGRHNEASSQLIRAESGLHDALKEQ